MKQYDDSERDDGDALRGFMFGAVLSIPFWIAVGALVLCMTGRWHIAKSAPVPDHYYSCTWPSSDDDWVKAADDEDFWKAVERCDCPTCKKGSPK